MAAPRTASETKAPFLDTGTVAKLLRMHQNTLRDNLIPLEDWRPGSSAIPFRKIGGRRMIPRWWVEEVIRQGNEPPIDEAAEKATKAQKVPRRG